jgi:hypothetical protein
VHLLRLAEIAQATAVTAAAHLWTLCWRYLKAVLAAVAPPQQQLLLASTTSGQGQSCCSARQCQGRQWTNECNILLALTCGIAETGGVNVIAHAC